MVIKVDYAQLVKTLKGKKVPKPTGGTLAGHAAGEPFDKLVYQEITKQHSAGTYRQFEYLNELYMKHPKAITYDEREGLISSPIISFLLTRGKSATVEWSKENQFEEKQNDTADIILHDDESDFYEFIDVKTRNRSK